MNCNSLRNTVRLLINGPAFMAAPEAKSPPFPPFMLSQQSVVEDATFLLEAVMRAVLKCIQSVAKKIIHHRRVGFGIVSLVLSFAFKIYRDCCAARLP